MKPMDPTPSYLQYWGKKSRDEHTPAFHLLPYHALDVAAVGSLLLRNDPLLRERLSIIGLEEQELESLIGFLLAVHDTGKFSTPAFQLMGSDLPAENRMKRHHADLGYRLWREHLWRKAIDEGWIALKDGMDADNGWRIIDPLLKLSCGHHGRPPDEEGTSINEWFTNEDRFAAEEFVRDCTTLFLGDRPLPLSGGRESIRAIKKASWLIAGLCVLADWIGSDEHYFPFREDIVDLSRYLTDTAFPNAATAIREKGAIPAVPSQERKIEDLFPEIFPEHTPTPLQAYASSCPLGEGPHLFIIEDATGSGKTEAAITLAHRLMVAGEGQGIYIALPTMATANAMYGRVETVAERLFENNTYSTVLAHSASRLYGALRAYLEGKEGVRKYSSSGAAWLADNRKKALLAQVGVGTIDQALLGILPVRHQSLRLLGLSRNILIVDEVHACDPYMHELLQRLLEFHGAMGGSAILLSATLPANQRKQLAKSFARRIPDMETELQADGYPLLTHISRSAPEERIFPMARERRIAVSLTTSPDEADAAVVTAARSGMCVCRIRNTVDDAVATWRRLSMILPEGTVHLFHARFTLGDRLKIEKGVEDHFGKKSTPESRRGQVIVATQVVEQSLDLDFDFMVTDLAPIDRIIQRAGRVHRHERGERGTPHIMVLAPETPENPDERWFSRMFPGGAAVYPDHARLWLTAKLLSRGEIKIPGDAHPFIEAVFGDESETAIPASLRLLAAMVRGTESADASFAAQNALKLKPGYSATGEGWRADVRTPTRLGEPSVTLRLARWDNDRIAPWADDPDPRIAWDLSQVNIRESQVAAAAEHTGPLARAVETAIAAMPDRGRNAVIVPLVLENGEWTGVAAQKSGAKVRVRYNSEEGLAIARKEAENSDHDRVESDVERIESDEGNPR
ncbi:CRISPR-associated helicase Cas3' [Methanoculleus sp. UBA208]|uniref:CRISPR-associated helicase Cas3' n=2 Tax=unclassified Methanoculleus TaxID=2619537 RepID=UPI0025D8F8AC|nr:CRISPR-associated helicase Cas3' [Methanoculleus sp. UBA208]